MANTIKIKAGSGTPTTSNIADRELAFDRSADKLYINDAGSIVDLTPTQSTGDITAVTAGTGLDGGGSSGDVSLSVDVSDFMSNGSNDRILTATGTDAMNAEANLTFDGNTLTTDALIIDGGGTYAAGSIYSDSNWGMLFRAKQASPGQAEFRWANSADSELMRINSGGNVGIGGSPEGNAKLDIKMSGVSQYLKLERSSSTGRAQIQLANESGTELWRFGLTGGGSEDFTFWDGSFNHLVFDRSANSASFGGAVTTGGQLNIEDTNAIIYRNSGQMELITYGGYDINLNPAGDVVIDGASIFLPVGERLYFGGGNHTYISEDADDRLRFFVGGAEFMRFTESTGNSFSIYEDVYIPDDKKIHFGGGNDLKIYHYNAAGDSRINVANNPLLITYNDVDRFRLASGDLVINEGGGDYNFRVEGDTDANLLFVDGGTDRVGIGTASPQEELDIIGSLKVRGDSAAATEVLELGQFVSPNITTPQYTFNTYDAAGGLPSMGDHLEIRSVRWGQSISFSRNGQGGAVPSALFYNGGNQGYMELYRATNPTTDATYTTQVKLNVNGNSYLNGGNVGVGTASPSYKLDVSGTGRFTGLITASGGIFTDGSSLGYTSDGYSRASSGNASVPGFSFASDTDTGMYRANVNSLGFTTAGNFAMIIDNSQNVGIGTASPGAKLDVKSQINVTNSNNDSMVGLKGTNFGYSTSYRALQIGATSGTYSIALGYDPSTNASPSFTGDGREVIFRNGVEFTTPNSANNGFHNDVMVLKDGNVGIGVASPSNGLELYGAARNIYVTNTTEDAAGIIMQDAQDAGQNGRIVYDSGANKLYIQTHGGTGFTMDSSRNVGIGTASPAEKLHVVGDVRIDTDLYIQPTNKFYLDGGLDTYIKESSANVMEFYCADSRRMQLTTTYLQVPDGAYLAAGNDNDIFIRHDGNGHLQSNAGTMFINQVSNNSMIFSTSNTERIRVEGGGDVGINCTNPPFQLKVNVTQGTYTSWETIAGFQAKRSADSETEAGIMINSLGDALGGQISSNWYWSNNTGQRANTGRSSGVFGIANSTTTYSEFYWQVTPHNSNTQTTVMELDGATSTLHVDGDVVAYSTTVSDKRLKDNVETIDNALEKVMKLRGVEFDWIGASRKGQHDIGLIAQEVEEVIPEIVREKEFKVGEFTDNKQTFKTVDYDKMVGVLIEAIKEQQVQIDELKTKIGE